MVPVGSLWTFASTYALKFYAVNAYFFIGQNDSFDTERIKQIEPYQFLISQSINPPLVSQSALA